jgi:hypothetical protein
VRCPCAVVKKLLKDVHWEQLFVNRGISDRARLRFVPDLLDVGPKREPDTDQVCGWQDDTAKVHERLDLLLEEDVVCWVGLRMVASLARGFVVENFCLWARSASQLELLIKVRKNC